MKDQTISLRGIPALRNLVILLRSWFTWSLATPIAWLYLKGDIETFKAEKKRHIKVGTKVVHKFQTVDHVLFAQSLLVRYSIHTHAHTHTQTISIAKPYDNTAKKVFCQTWICARFYSFEF